MDSGDKKNRRRRRWIDQARIDYKKNKWLFFTYFILRVLVLGIMVAQFFNANYENMFLCILVLVLFLIPSFVERRIKIDVPDTLEIIILLMIFAAWILGEIAEYYVVIPYWDTMLHTLNGFICAAVGFSLVDILNRSDKFSMHLSPLYLCLVAFCFSMTIGVLWEFFEFAMDRLFLFDMQKDTWLTTVSSVLIHPEGKNIPVVIEDIDKVLVYSGDQVWEFPAYLDVGLFDTMIDLFVNFIGAVVFSIIGYFYVKRQQNDRFIRHFVPTPISDEAPETKDGTASEPEEDDTK